MVFQKEAVLPKSDKSSPFYINLPPHDTKPIDLLVEYFKYWKYFIKSLAFYLKEVSLVKEFEANLNMQLLNTVQFPGFKELPAKVKHEINNQVIAKSPSQSTVTTPTDEQQPKPGLYREKSGTSVLTRGEKEVVSLATTLKNTTKTAASLGHKKTKSLGSNSSAQVSQASLAASSGNDLNIPKSFFPGESMFCNMSPMLLQHHATKCTTNAKLTRDLKGRLIPRLEVLQKNLGSKIKEIKQTLRNDAFANTEYNEEMSCTGRVLSEYMSAVERYSAPKPVVKNSKYLSSYDSSSDTTEYNPEEDAALDDPFLVKMRLDYQLKKQLTLENYKFASYVNLQSISRDLHAYVVKDLSAVIEKFGKLEFSKEIYDFFSQTVRQQSVHDWRYFVSHNKAFINVYDDTPENPKRQTRLFKSLVVPYGSSVHSKCLRTGAMYKKSKMLKNYTKFYYVLSANYLHEYREEDWKMNKAKHQKKKNEFGITHNDVPVKSYNLNEYQITDKHGGDGKFILSKRGSKTMAGKTTFKCISEPDFKAWFQELSELLAFEGDHLSRFEFINLMIARRETERQSKLGLKRISNVPKDSLSTPEAFGDMFDPHIATPKVLSPDEINPFEITDIAVGQSHSATEQVSTTNGTPPSTNPTHEQFMKMQREAINQQLNGELQEKLENVAGPPIHMQLHTPRGSSDSLKSMASFKAPDVGKILDNLDSSMNATFSLGENDASSLDSRKTTPPKPITKVPTFSVSQAEDY